MTTHWHPDQDATPTPGEVQMMAAALEGRHGTHAEDVARFFVDANANQGDASRSWAWAAVAECLKKRMDERIAGRIDDRRRDNVSARRLG